MKSLIAFASLLVISTSIASAGTTLVDPVFASGTNSVTVGPVTTPGTAPLTYTAGTPFTQTVTGGDTLTYSPTSMTSGDLANYSGKSYIQTTVSPMHIGTLTTDLTFTPTYTTDSNRNDGNQTNIDLFEIDPQGANNPLFRLTLGFANYGDPRSYFTLSAGVQFFNGTGVQDVAQGTQTFSGQKLTLHDVTTSTYVGPAPAGSGFVDIYSIENKGAIFNSVGYPIYTFDFTATGGTGGGGVNGYDPRMNPDTISLGILNSGGDGILTGGSVEFSSLTVTNAPEPSTYALMLGGLGLLVLVARRKLTA